MAYMNDPRENYIDLEKQAIWESDNREEARWKWNSLVTDLCDMPVEEYMKNPIIEAINNSSSSSTEGIQELNDNVTDFKDKVLDKMDDDTNIITSAISEAAQEIADVLSGSVFEQIPFYYASVNNKVPVTDLTQEMFTLSSININSEGFFTYVLGDPTEEDWNLYTAGTITEEELVDRSNNNYYFVVPDAYGISKKFIILEEGTSDVTNEFLEVSELHDLFDGFVVFKSYDKDHFNIDYPNETNVRITHKLKLFR